MTLENNLKRNIVIILLLVFSLFPIYKVNAQNSKNTTNPTKNTSILADTINAINSQSNINIRKIIGENTPEFMAKPIIVTIDFLEEFRKNNFNNVFIFYGLLIVIFILIIRFVWRLIF